MEDDNRSPGVAEKMSLDSSRGSLEPLDHRIGDGEDADEAGAGRPVTASANENGTQDANSESSTSDTITQSAPAALGQTLDTRSSEGSVSEVTDSGAPGGADEATPEEDDEEEGEDGGVCWKRSRCVKIEKRAEGFGFTLRNVVIYPSDIHKIATALSKRPKDVEPSWVEGKPLDAVLVREVRESGAAQSAGLRPGDRIVAHEGRAIESYSKFVAQIHLCSSVLEVTVISGADDPLSCGLWASGPGSGLSRSVNATGLGVPRQSQRSHWLSSSLAPRPYLSTYHRGNSTQPRSLPNHSLIHSSPINQSTVSLTESTTGGSVSGAESEMSLSMPSIPIPPSCSVPSRLDSTLKPQRKKRRDKNKTSKHNKKDSKRISGPKDEESRSSSLSSLGPPSPAGTTSVAAKLQLFEGGQGFLARSMEKLKLYRSELTRMASPPPNTVQVRTAQFEKVGVAGDKKGTTSPPPGATLKKLKTLFTEKSIGGGCALKVLRCPEGGKKLDHNWRPAEVLTETVDGRPVLKVVTDKDSINVILNRLLTDPADAHLSVDFATLDYAKRRKNVLRLSSASASLVRDCALCPERDSYTDYEFLIQCDTPVTMHNICSVINAGCSESVKIAPSVIERAAAFDRRFFKNHRNHPGYKSISSGASVQRSKSRRASVGDEPSLVLSRAPNSKDKGLSIGVPLENCRMSTEDPMVPWIVVHCCKIIEGKGLDVTGVYRVPGNSAAVQHLTQVVNLANGKNMNLNDSKWADVNVVTSLLKSFFRLLPEPLLTSSLYYHFITVDKIPDCRNRLGGIRALIQKLPAAHLETLRYFCMHLQRVAARSETNKMDSRNLSIVLGPTLVRNSSPTGQCSMLSMISDMQHQCHITETLINYADYLFYSARCGEPSSVLATLIDLDPLPSSSSSESLISRREKKSAFSRALSSKLSLLPGTPTPILSVKQKILSFECGKCPVLEESGLSCSFPPSPSKSSAAFLDDTLSSLTSSLDDPMSMSYHERRVLAQEKAKVFEEETRAVLEKKAFRSRDQKMSREQTERRWQEVKRQATLLTRDNSDDNIDKENQSSQNVESCLASQNAAPASGIDERDSLRNAAPPCNVEQKEEEVVMLRTRSGKNIHRGNRYGVVYSPNSSKILKSIVQSEDCNREGSQRKKSRLERRHTIAGSHSHSHQPADKSLNRTPSERNPKMHRSTT